MADIGFDRPDGARSFAAISILCAIFIKSLCQSRDFNRISQRGACSVRFDITNGAAVNVGDEQGI